MACLWGAGGAFVANELLVIQKRGFSAPYFVPCFELGKHIAGKLKPFV